MALNENLNIDKLNLISENGRTWICNKSMNTVAFNSTEDLRNAMKYVDGYLDKLKEELKYMYDGLNLGIERYGLENTIKILHDLEVEVDELDIDICNAIYSAEPIDNLLLKYIILLGNDKVILDKCEDDVFPLSEIDDTFIDGSAEEYGMFAYYWFDRNSIDVEILKKYMLTEEEYNKTLSLEPDTEEWLKIHLKYVEKVLERIKSEILVPDID